MFGYVRPLRPELKVREYEAYQGVYCGLCHTMGERYGFLARMLLNYDFTFLAMLLSYDEPKPAANRRRCPVHPFRGKTCCGSTAGMESAADKSLILAYWKFLDNVEDSGFCKGLGARILCVMLRPAYRKAVDICPKFDQQVKVCMEQLHQLERENSPAMDRVADTFARILQSAADDFGDTDRQRGVSQLLYHLGRWIYLVDAWDDLEEDKKRGNYNPILARFPEGTEEQVSDLRTTMCHSRNLVASASALYSFGYWNEIVANILHLGLPMVEGAVFAGTWKKRNKQAGET